MASLGTRLSRRDLFKLGGLTVANLVVPSSHDRRLELAPLIKQRQQFLDQLVEKEPSPYAGRVIYDHERSLSKEASYVLERRILDDPQALRYINRYSDYFTGDFNLTEEEIPELIGLPKLIKDAIVFFKLRFQTYELHAHAVTKGYPLDFGKGVKPDIFVFGNALEKLHIETPHGMVEIPTEKRVRALLQHEYIHAEDIYKGINLGNGLVIDSSNHVDINPRVKKFVMESRAYLRAVEFSRQLGISHPVYWYTLRRLLDTMTEIYNEDIKDRKFTPYETRMIEFQKNKVDAVSQEAKSFEKFKLR